METFIAKIAQHIYQQNYSYKHLTVILPSLRAKKYLQRALFECYKKPIFSPRIITMNRWIQDLSEHPIIHPTRALFKLYQVHLQVDKAEPQTMDEFLKWGQILLSDFDEIDRYLIDSKDLFKNLADIKEIENWSFGSEEELTEGQKRYMHFWDLLADYYSEFNKRLKQDGECYMGNAYKSIANDIQRVFHQDKEARFIFAGFNALSPAETTIMKKLHQMGRADVFVDADSYYLNNKTHEAGRFIHNLFDELKVKTLPFVVDELNTAAKDITIINCAQPTGQAKASATILHDEIPHNEFSETLLLLADEQLIVPVMKNIPKNVGKTNITLGLPLKNTAVRSWVDLLFVVQENFLHFGANRIYYKDFLRFIKHPFILGYCSLEEQKLITNVELQILNQNWTFIYPKNIGLGEQLSQLIQYFFTPWKWNDGDSPIHLIRKLNQEIYTGLNNEQNAIERSILFHFDHTLTQIEAVLEEFRPKLGLKTFKSLFNQHWINESIAYYGNPLDGLQVMGLLETRLIDFKNIIVVGLNDGSMPPTNPIQSMIMMDLRRFHGLPTPREKQGLFAHHFYRLLHKAQKCWITYSSANRESGGMDEPSRYILQLQLELARQNPKISIKNRDYTITNEESRTNALRVPKSQTIIERMDAYFSTRTSASALKTALRCPLDFYYKYLLGLGEEDKVEEEIEASTFGEFIHKTLQILYDDFAMFDKDGNKKSTLKSVSYHDIQLMRAKQKKIMEDQFNSFFHYNNDFKMEGKNYLSFEIAQHLTDRFLAQEEQHLKAKNEKLYIHGLEIKLYKEMTLPIHGEEKTIRWVGVLDRVDEVNGEKRILDYKSGKCSEADVKLSGKIDGKTEEEVLDILITKLKNSRYAFQLLVYIMLYHEKFNQYPDKVGIVSMVNLTESPFYLDNQLTETTEELMNLFRKALIKMIEELYDESESFEHNPKSMYCGYCV